MIPFNIPCVLGSEKSFIRRVIKNRKLSGDGPVTHEATKLLESALNCKKALLTTSGTHALEMAAILADIQAGDEVIMPSYTFVSTANAFVLRGAKIVFVDIRPDTMNIDEKLIGQAITKKTKAIVVVHYGGVACEMNEIMKLAKKHNLLVIEDAAQAIMAKYKGKFLGTIGDLGCLSFHETKNITSGEGGALLINRKNFVERAEIIREKGTDRSKFFRGEVDKYTWVDIGSSYLPSEFNAAFLNAQLRRANKITFKRQKLWDLYNKLLGPLEKKGLISLGKIPDNCSPNGHLFFIKTKDLAERSSLIAYLKKHGIMSVFHYLPLHSSKEGKKRGRFSGRDKFTTKESERLLRLPLFYSLKISQVKFICQKINDFYLTKEDPASLNESIMDRINASLMVAVMSTVLGLVYWVARFGFENNSFSLILLILGLSFFITFLPSLVDIYSFKRKTNRWCTSAPFTYLGGLLALVVLGLIVPLINLAVPISIAGYVLMLTASMAYFRSTKEKSATIGAVIFGILFAGWAAGVIWGGGYLDPLFIEKSALGHTPMDPLFHSSISNMIAKLHTPSTGIDGLPYLRYHWGSHFIFAQFANLLKVGGLEFYNMAYPIIFAPFLIRAYLYLIESFKKYFKTKRLSLWLNYIPPLIAFAGIMTLSFYKDMGILIGDIMVSESYALGAAFSFLIIAFVLHNLEHLAEREPVSSRLIFVALVLPLFLAIIGLLKVSLLLILLVVAAFLFLRLGLYRAKPFILSVIVIFTLAFIVLQLSYQGTGSNIFFLHYLKHWVKEKYHATYPFFNYFWVLSYIILKLKILRLKGWSDFVASFQSKKLLDVELLLVVVVTGAIPGLLFEVPAGSAFFFSDIQRWLAIALVIAHIDFWWPRKFFVKDENRSYLLFTPVVLAILILVATSHALENIKTVMNTTLRGNLESRYDSAGEESLLSRDGHFAYFNRLRKEKMPLFSALQETFSAGQKSLNKNKRYKMLILLKQAGAEAGKDTIFYIPQDNALYWEFDSYRNSQFISTAVSGLPMIGGIPPYLPSLIKHPLTKEIEDSLNKNDKSLLLEFYEYDDKPKNPIYKLKPQELTESQKIAIYNLVAPYSHRELEYYGFESYPPNNQEEYLKRFSSDDKLCKSALEKGFLKVLVLTTDQNGEPNLGRLECK